ncbi:MAG: sodium:proton antiporter, partial [Bacteroidales bacterium]|nr:sodium:proton antiporter [Bacteroidales bacterium]
GAYFGDKISPLSDTTVLASSTTDTPLFTHIRYMLITTIPSFTIESILFLIVSLSHPSSSSLMIGEFSEGLQKPFNISPWLIIVPVITGFLIAKKIPAIATLFLASLTAGITAIIAQPDLLLEIGGADGFEGYFRGIMTTTFGSTSIQTGNETLDNLIQTSGMTGMLATIFLIITASTFGGALTGSGMIKSLTDTLAKNISGRKSLVSATVATGLFCNMTTGDQYLSILLTNNLYKKLYDRKGFERRLLSRTTEDSCTVTSVLIPWNSCGMTQSTVLKVPTLDYLPYCFFNILSPLMSMFIAFIGYKIFKKEPIDT